MWFKNLKLFRLNPDWTITTEELEVALQARAFVEGNASDTTNLGWISPLDALLTDLVNSLGGFKHVSQ